MKLRSIIHALAYGKSRPSLVRSEGARRVKQAEVMMNLRQTQKTLSYCAAYGTDSKLEQFVKSIDTGKWRAFNDIR